MSTTTLQLGEDLSRVLQTFERPLEQMARELIVLELYRRHRISSGKAAELLGTPKIDFIQYASSLGIPYIDMSSEEFEEEMAEVEKITLEHRL
jgi:predicted HTH domain antitoxin